MIPVGFRKHIRKNRSKAGNGSLLYKIQKPYANVVGLIRAFIGPFMVSQLTEVIFNLNWFRFFFRHLQKPKKSRKKNFNANNRLNTLTPDK